MALWPKTQRLGGVQSRGGADSVGMIQRLPEEVASQVAAGEVVERPASVAKELIENAIDAGATRVDVEYRRGGTGYLAVADDGRGMDRDDAVLCLERHATSKIRTGRDLETVATFGFRGEAVPSIASVSKFRLTTRERGAAEGTEVAVAGGRIEDVRASGAAEGTRIEVRNLFYNLPARRKFLRGERTEAAHIEQAFLVAALANPEVRFTLSKDGKQTRLLAAGGDLRTRVRDLSGADFLRSLFAFEKYEHNGLEIRGLLARPGHGRGDRSQQFWFVNGRAIVSSALSQPLREAYGTALPRGMQPPAVLFVRMDAREVDCNVHPAKREVRFRDGIAVREAVGACVRAALVRERGGGTNRGGGSEDPGRGRGNADAEKPGDPVGTVDDSPAGSDEFRVANVLARRKRDLEALESSERATSEGAGALEHPGAPENFVESPPRRLVEVEVALHPELATVPERFRFVGRLGERFVVMEDAAGMVLLDHRAARERIWFERTLRRMASGEGASQRLLLPAVVELAPKDEAWVRENAPSLQRAGLLVETFGRGSVKVDGLPPMLGAVPAAEVLLRLIDDGRASGASGRIRAVEEVIARSVARFAPTEELPGGTGELRDFLGELMACDLPYTCPSGKPTLVHFSFGELERKFGRGVRVQDSVF